MNLVGYDLRIDVPFAEHFDLDTHVVLTRRLLQRILGQLIVLIRITLLHRLNSLPQPSILAKETLHEQLLLLPELLAHAPEEDHGPDDFLLLEEPVLVAGGVLQVFTFVFKHVAVEQVEVHHVLT